MGFRKGSPEAKEYMKTIRELAHVGSVRQRRILEEKKANLLGMLKKAAHPEFDGDKLIDVKQVSTDLRETERNQARIAPNRGITTAERGKLGDEAKQLEETIKDGMPTRDEMYGDPVTIRGNPVAGRKESEEIVEKHMAWLERTQGQQHRYQHIMRQLEPDDPHAGSVENLRRIH